jgi:cold shock protein
VQFCTADSLFVGIIEVSSRINALTSRNIDMNGTIKRLVSDKGFGFIAAGDGTEYFFHQSACTGTAFDQLREGQAVTFDVGHGAKGPRGENVKVA